MASYGGSLTFRAYSIAFTVFFIFHLAIQWILTKIYGPYGKKHENIEEITDSKDEPYDINQEEVKK